MKFLIKALVVATFWLGFSVSASAHKLAPSLLDIRQQGATDYAVLFRTPVDAQRRPEPVFPPLCTLSEPQHRSEGTALETRWKLHCEPGLSGQDVGVAGLRHSRTTALLRITKLSGAVSELLLTAEAPTHTVDSGAASSGVFMQYLGLGFSHILIGLDHLLFVAGLLLLAATWRQLLLTVTAFTVGHSITLVLVSLGILPHWPALVELAIAATILVLAVELSRAGGEGGLLRRYPWPMALAFGLIHGLGFAGVLAELGLPADHLFKAVLAFNIGIEFGQLTFVALLAALLAAITRLSTLLGGGLRRALVYSMGGISVFWCLDRGQGFIAELSRWLA